MGNKKRSRSTNPQRSGQGSRPEDPVSSQPASSNAKRSLAEEPVSSAPKRLSLFSDSAPLPTFLIVHSLHSDRPLGNVSPFFIAKSLQSLAGSPKSVRKLRSGDLLVETLNPKHSELLLKTTMLGDIPVTVSAHAYLNSSRGVISERDLVGCPETELVTELSSQGVIAARRILFKRDGALVPSHTVILTFNRPTLPTDIKAGYLHCEVRPYIPNPVRCFKCQVYGHSQQACRGTATCGQCGKTDHDGSSCAADAFCVNCKGDHPAFSRSCPRWSQEKEIQRIKTLEGLSYQEARKKVAPIPSGSPSYAAVLLSKVASAAQTTALQSSAPATASVGTMTSLPDPTPATTVSVGTMTSVPERPTPSTSPVGTIPDESDHAPSRRSRARADSAERPPSRGSSPARSRSPIRGPSPVSEDAPVSPPSDPVAAPSSSDDESTAEVNWEEVVFPTTFQDMRADDYFSQFLPPDDDTLQRLEDMFKAARCFTCRTPFTFRHILFTCLNFLTSRSSIFGQNCFPDTAHTLSRFFGDPSCTAPVIDFLHAITHRHA